MGKRTFGFITGILTISIAVLAVGPVPAQAAVASYSLNCATMDIPKKILYTDSTVSLTLQNCATFQKFDNTGQVVSSGNISNGPHTLAINDWYEFHDSQGTAGWIVLVAPIYPQHRPAGNLLFTQDVTIPAQAPEFLTGAPNGDDEYELGGNAHCSLSATPTRGHVYSTVDVTVKQNGTYTFRGISSGPSAGSYYQNDLFGFHPLEDPFLALYRNFDPTHPDEGVLACNDDMSRALGYQNKYMQEDIGGGLVMEAHQPYLTSQLTPGHYTLVLATWDSIGSAAWVAGVNSEGSTWTPGSSYTRVQLWGPTGGLTLGHTSELANTGSKSDLNALLAGFAAILGGLVLTLTRRGSRVRN